MSGTRIAGIERLPDDAQCREQLASLRLDAGGYAGAASQFQNLLPNGIASKEIIDNLAFSLMNTGDHAEATELFESSLKRYGQDGWIYFNLGYMHRCRGDLRAAALDLQRAARLIPSDPEINYNLGVVLHLSKRYGPAVDSFQTAIPRKPGWGPAYFNLALAYWSLGQYAMALSQARLAQENGVQEAGSVVRMLSESLSLAAPRVVIVQRSRRLR